jgi:hypothetical protein
MGTIVINPPYDTTGCDTDSTGTTAVYCTDADVALGERLSGINPSYGVGTSTTEGLNGAVGTQTINGVYAVPSYTTASQVPASRNLVHKSGFRTGTTTGAVISTCTDGWIRLTQPIAGVTGWLELKCQVVLDHMGWGTGDSGAPVFARLWEGGAYYALGIEVAGTGPYDPFTKICSNSACRMMFSPWTAIQSRTSLYLSPVP